MLLKLLLRWVCKIYFSKIELDGIKNIDPSKPVIFTPNHPSGWMDPILIALYADRPVHFIARGESFQTRFQRFLLGRLRMIPVYRPDKTAHLTHKNKSVFSKCHKILENNGAIIIFPEGLSNTTLKLGPFKSGAVRMALGAEQKNAFELGVQIIPVGLNYSNPHKFRSKVSIVIGKALDISNEMIAYKNEPHKTARRLTDKLKKQVSALSTNVVNEGNFSVYEELKKLQECSVIHVNRSLEINRIDDLPLKDIHALAHYSNSFNHICRQHGIEGLKKNTAYFPRYNYIVLFILFPFYAVSYPVLWSIGWITDSIIKRSDFRGSMMLTIGLIFLSCTLGGGFIASTIFGLHWVLALCLPIISVLFLGLYLDTLDSRRDYLASKKFGRLIKDNPEIVARLLNLKSHVAKILVKESGADDISVQA